MRPDEAVVPGSDAHGSGVSERCANCDAPLAGSYCHMCGQKAELRDLSFRRFVMSALGDLFHLDSKLLRSLRLLVSRPGRLTTAFVRGHRARYVQPLQLYFLAASIFFIIGTYRPIVRFDPDTRQVTSTLNAVTVGGDVPPEHVAELARRGISIDLFAERFRSSVNGHLPTFLIGSVLLFSLAIAAAYFRTRRRYLEHLAFALHWSAFYLLLMCVGLLAPRSPPAAVVSRVVEIISLILALVYLFSALRTVYRQPVLLTLAKAAVLFLWFNVLLALWVASVVAWAMNRI